MSAVAQRVLPAQGVVIAIDPHKASWTAVVVTAALAPAGRSGSRPTAPAIGGCGASPPAGPTPGGRSRAPPVGCSAGRAAARGRDHRGRRAGQAGPPGAALSTGHGRKSDPADALSVGIAAWSAPALRSVEIDQAIAALRAVTEHRDDLVRARTQPVNRLHVLLVKLVPTGLGRGLTAESAAEALRRVRPRDALGHRRGR